MKSYIAGLCFVLLAVVAVAPAARAETTTTSVSASLTLLQNLMKQVEELQKQLAALRGEIKEVQAELRDGLREGVENDDVKKIQELLATDPSIYPKGLVSGYYGPLTADAVRAFQRRHDLKVTGEVDAETKALMLEYFKERTGGKIPPGLLKAPGIDKKIKDRLKKDDDGDWYLDCDDKKAAGPFCKDRDDDDDEDEDEDENEDDDDRDTRAKSAAERAIDAASDAITDLENAIADTEDEDEKEDAEDELEEAEEYLAKAETFFEDDRYSFAYSNAVKARRTAEKALDVLVNQDDSAAATVAEDMIEAAAAAIDDLKDAIEDATDEDDIEDAEEELAEAEALLEDAEEDYDEEEYRRAYDRALEAKMTAFNAIEDLEDND